MDNHQSKVFTVFQEVFSLPQDAKVDDLIYNEYEGWDSVGHMTLVASLEEAFDCMLDMDDILDMSSFSKSAEILLKYLENQGD